MAEVQPSLLPEWPLSHILIDPGSSGQYGWHGIESWLKCKQKWAYDKLTQIGESSDAREPLVKGTLMHIGCAHRYARMWARQNGADENQLYPPLDAMRVAAEKPEHAPVGPKVIQEVIDAFLAYEIYYNIERLRIETVEQVYGAWVGPDRFYPLNDASDLTEFEQERYDAEGNRLYAYTQRLDLVAADERGKIWFLDHKTTGRIEARTMIGYSMSGQFHGMNHLGELYYGSAFGGSKANLIQINKKPEFRRISPDPAPNALAQFPSLVYNARREIDEYRDRGTDPWNYPKTLSELVCVHRYGACDFIKQCQWGK